MGRWKLRAAVVRRGTLIHKEAATTALSILEDQ